MTARALPLPPPGPAGPARPLRGQSPRPAPTRLLQRVALLKIIAQQQPARTSRPSGSRVAPPRSQPRVPARSARPYHPPVAQRAPSAPHPPGTPHSSVSIRPSRITLRAHAPEPPRPSRAACHPPNPACHNVCGRATAWRPAACTMHRPELPAPLCHRFTDYFRKVSSRGRPSALSHGSSSSPATRYSSSSSCSASSPDIRSNRNGFSVVKGLA